MPTIPSRIFPSTGVFALVLAACTAVAMLLTPLHAREDPVVTQRLLNAVSASGASAALGAAYAPLCRASAIYIDWGTGVASGVVTVETSYDAAYTGTWASLSAVTFSGTAPKLDVVQMAGTVSALRTRVSTIVAGGTVSSWVVCN